MWKLVPAWPRCRIVRISLLPPRPPRASFLDHDEALPTGAGRARARGAVVPRIVHCACPKRLQVRLWRGEVGAVRLELRSMSKTGCIACPKLAV